MLAQSFSPIVGGEERVVEDLSLALSKRGHEVSIATLEQPGGEPPPELGDIPIHTLRSSSHRLPGVETDAERRHAPPMADPETVLGLRRLIRAEKPQVVHAHNWIVHSYLPLSKRSQAALVLSNHDYGILCATKRLLRKGVPCEGPGIVKCVACAGSHYGAVRGLIATAGTMAVESKLRRAVDLFLPISSTVQRLCRLDDESSRVIPDLIARLPPSPAVEDPRLAQLPEEPYIFYFGDLTEDKGAWHLASVYRSLDDPPPLVMVGRNYLEELRDVPGLHALGPWPHDLAIEALRRSLFAVVPSLWPEPFGLVALEAAAAGKAVIASDIGGLMDIVVDGQTGLLVAPNDRPALREAINRLVDDDAVRAKLGEAAGERAPLFGPDVIVPRFESAYELALERRGSRHAGSRG
ncbi:MAG: glycosyltransferase family 4 protein [Solirubrobacterales bacterium]|nr:glycosyltransferase family 4 protein [Solirubrobacterales bacterium]